MGKSLIIKGADFSANGIPAYSNITWFLDSFNETYATRDTNISQGYFGPGNYSQLQGKTINCIKFKAAASGQLTIAFADGVGGSAQISQERIIEVSQDEVGTVVTKLFTPIEVSQSDYIVVGKPTDTAGWYFTNSYPDDAGTGVYTKIGYDGTGVKTTNRFDLLLSFGIAQ